MRLDLSGTRFGALVALYETASTKNNRSISWMCKCDCGRVSEKGANHLRHQLNKTCGKSCGLKPPKTGGWHKLRFTPDNRKKLVPCAICRTPLFLPPSKVGMYQTCGGACAKAFARRDIPNQRPCRTCGKAFTPRQVQLTKGQGIFCSPKCNTIGVEKLQSAEVRAKTIEGIARYRASPDYRPMTGKSHWAWRGGITTKRIRKGFYGKRNSRELRDSYVRGLLRSVLGSKQRLPDSIVGWKRQQLLLFRALKETRNVIKEVNK